MKIMTKLVRSGRFADEIMQMTAAEKDTLLASVTGAMPTQAALSRQ